MKLAPQFSIYISVDFENKIDDEKLQIHIAENFNNEHLEVGTDYMSITIDLDDCLPLEELPLAVSTIQLQLRDSLIEFGVK